MLHALSTSLHSILVTPGKKKQLAPIPATAKPKDSSFICVAGAVMICAPRKDASAMTGSAKE
jgi:hypothetical protein